ncbi:MULTISPECIES: hypothetical protein [unclassified Flavobacterium]|uniref:hypothetical protein n=1 Tax=unclassified Flavobacterium TaxID=196869 RepID=UPI0025BC9999|nr:MULTISPECIES: hypothetical protein [unclassified Flavobacterium]
MKKVAIIFLIILSFKSYSQSEKVIGKWINCVSSCDGIQINKNVCTNVEFKSDQTLLITYPGRKENLIWKIENQNLSFLNSNKEEESSLFLISELYVFKFNDNFDELIISEKANENCFIILGKSDSAE